MKNKGTTILKLMPLNQTTLKIKKNKQKNKNINKIIKIKIIKIK